MANKPDFGLIQVIHKVLSEEIFDRYSVIDMGKEVAPFAVQSVKLIGYRDIMTFSRVVLGVPTYDWQLFW